MDGLRDGHGSICIISGNAVSIFMIQKARGSGLQAKRYEQQGLKSLARIISIASIRFMCTFELIICSIEP
jgi:hypothetical protein